MDLSFRDRPKGGGVGEWQRRPEGAYVHPSWHPGSLGVCDETSDGTPGSGGKNEPDIECTIQVPTGANEEQRDWSASLRRTWIDLPGGKKEKNSLWYGTKIAAAGISGLVGTIVGIPITTIVDCVCFNGERFSERVIAVPKGAEQAAIGGESAIPPYPAHEEKRPQSHQNAPALAVPALLQVANPLQVNADREPVQRRQDNSRSPRWYSHWRM